MSELIALGTPFPAVLGVSSYLPLTVFFSHHEDKLHRLCFPAWGTEGLAESDPIELLREGCAFC